MSRFREYSVGQLARASGVTVRTLHHYDAIGLLRPAHVAANGYRTYGEAEALRLQEILFYRAFGLSLEEIAGTLAGEADRKSRLQRHRTRLAAEAARVAGLLDTLDRTIVALEKDEAMQLDELYRPFDAETQKGYETWLVETYGVEMAERITSSKAAVEAIPEGMDGAMARLREVEAALVAAYEAGGQPGAAAIAAPLAAHRALIAEMWGRPCPDEAYAGLADLYLSHPDFVARYERLARGFSHWLPAAMKASVA